MSYFWVTVWCLGSALFGWVGGFCFGWLKGEAMGADAEFRRLTHDTRFDDEDLI